MDGALLHSVWMVLLLVVFIGIVVWVFFLKQSSDFDDAARMPLEPDDFERNISAKERHDNG